MKAYRYTILLILLLASSLISLSAQNLAITNVTTTPTSCSDSIDGTISFDISGGVAPYRWFIYEGVGFPVDWGGPTFSTSITSVGRRKLDVYLIGVKDTAGTSVYMIADVDGPDPMQITDLASTSIRCNNDNNGSITVTAIGESGSPVYELSGPGSPSNTTGIFTNLPGGIYTVTARDGGSCTSTDVTPAITIINPAPIDATVNLVTNVACFGEASGAIDINVSGGITPYIYEWSNSSGTPVSSIQDPVGLPANTYSLLITDANGCIFNFPDLATISEPPLLSATLSKTDISCFGADDGSITVAATGGAGGYTYSSDGSSYQGGAIFGSLPPGPYTIWTRDVNMCVFTDTITILEPEEILIQSETATYLCPGNLLGTISINGVSGGIAPYTYSINGGTDFYTTNLFTNLAPDSYQTVVRDASGCSVNGNLNVLVEPAPFQITSYIQDDITSCFNRPEGRIQISATGGTGTISYSLNGDPPVTTGDFQNLPGGPYIVTMIDGNACTHDTSVVILAPPELTLDNIVITDVTVCGGNTNGGLVVTGSGGTGLLEFSLDDVNYQPSGTFSSLGAGDYTAWIRDANGCTVNAPASITEPVPVLATVAKTDVSYGTLGTIAISNVTGGTTPYEYSINGLAGPFTSTTTYIDLIPATYQVIVRDQDGCTFEETVVILDVLPLDVVVNVTHVSCFGADDGTIEFVPQNAEGAVQYSIDNGANFQSDPLFENLAGNITYQLVALDAAGKLFTGVVILIEPTEILFSHLMTPAQCNAFSPTGAIDITVSGGAGSFTYLWSDGSTQEDRSNIQAGVYDLLITDANNCTRNESIIVSSEVSVQADAGEDASICAGSSTQLQGAGVGIPSWDPSPFLSDETILDPVASGMTTTSTFVLTIAETVSPYGCYNKDSVRVTIHPLMGLETIQDTFVIEGHSIRLETTGGTFDQYRWEPETGLDNSTSPDPIATPMVPTRYFVFAINSYGCEEVDDVFIDVIEDIQAYNVFSPNGDGINDYFEIKNAERFPEMLVEVYGRWGDQYFSTVGYDSGSQWDGTARGKEAPVGTYYYILIPYPGAKPISGNVTIIR